MLALYQTPFKAMGSPCELKLYCQSAAHAETITQHIIQKVRELEKKYTRFKPDSITSQINNSAGSGKKVTLDQETRQLLNYADTLFSQSDGLFDITSGVLREAWNFKSNRIPTNDELEPLLARIGWQKILCGDDWIELPTVGMQIDFGGFVKEYTADIVANICIEQGIQHGLVNLGGDVRIIGPHPDGQAWRVGIQHPRKPQKPIAYIDVYSGAIATSGDYERFMIVNNQRYSHLLNPNTGKSIRANFASVSIYHESCLIAGSFSTIGMLKSEIEPAWLESTGLSYLTVDQNLTLSGDLNQKHNANL